MRAMILAAGLGSRMRPLTDHCPKPLLPLAGKPLIVHHIEQLVAKGIVDIVINHAYLGHMIENALGDGSQFGCCIHYSAEQTALETGGGILKALPLLTQGLAVDDDAPFLLVNGDVWLEWQEIDLTYASAISGLGYLWLVDNPEHNPGGDFSLAEAGGMVSTLNQGEPSYTFSGISVLRPSLFKDSTPGAFPLAPLLKKAMSAQKIYGERYQGHWVDVGTPERLQQVERLLLRLDSTMQAR